MDSKNYIGPLLAILLLLLVSCASENPNSGNEPITGAATDVPSEPGSPGPTNKIDEDSTIEDFKGRPSLIIFASTNCGHCVDAVPEIEKKIFKPHGHKINLWLNVANGDRFSTEIAQGLNKNLDFEKLTGSSCRYVPSWVLMDEDGGVALKSCGSEKDLGAVVRVLEVMGGKND